MKRIAFMIAMAAGPVAAQDTVTSADGAVIRTLDKLNGIVEDMDLRRNSARQVGRIEVALSECRYPAGNPAGDAYAFVTVRETGVRQPVFRGWMIASSPALNPMEHPRYDVWVLRCSTS